MKSKVRWLVLLLAIAAIPLAGALISNASGRTRRAGPAVEPRAVLTAPLAGTYSILYRGHIHILGTPPDAEAASEPPSFLYCRR